MRSERIDHSVTRLATDNPESQALQDACDWIRDNTQPDSLVISFPPSRDARLIPVLAQHRLLVARPSMETEGVSHYEFMVNEKWRLQVQQRREFVIEAHDADLRRFGILWVTKHPCICSNTPFQRSVENEVEASYIVTTICVFINWLSSELWCVDLFEIVVATVFLS